MYKKLSRFLLLPSIISCTSVRILMDNNADAKNSTKDLAHTNIIFYH
jgi:hypothetical protein